MHSSSVPRHRPVLKKPGEELVNTPAALIPEPTIKEPAQGEITDTDVAIPEASEPQERLVSLPPLAVESTSAITKELFTQWRFDY